MSATGEGAGTDPNHPWPGLDSFTEAASRYFFGREAESDELFRRIRRETTTLLFGQSGRGKTSLLQAGLFPRLRQEGFLPVVVRVDYGAPGDLFEQVKALLRAAFDAAGVAAPPFAAGESLWQYLHRRDLAILGPGGEEAIPVIVFDQFETVFTLGLRGQDVRAKCRAFLIELADLVENRPSAELKARIEGEPDLVERYVFNRDDYRIVIALREDYLPHLESLRARAPSLGPNRFRLTRMAGAQAMEAVLGPAGALVDADVAQQIVKVVASRRLEDPFVLMEGDAADPILGLEVEPALLSLFCRGLNDARLQASLPRITPELLAQRREAVIESFYEHAFAGEPPALREFVEDELVTEAGFRDSMTRARAERALGARGVPASALDDLVRGRLLRIEERLEDSRVELIHDLLTDVVLKSRRRRRQAQEERRVRARRRFTIFAGVAGGLLLATTLALIGVVVHARAVQADLHRRLQQELAQCTGGDPARSVAGCTAFLKTGQKTAFAAFGMVYYDRGNAYVRLGDYKLAIGDFTRAIGYTKDDPDFYINRGIAYEGAHDYDGAVRDYTQAINLKPNVIDLIALENRCFDSAASNVSLDRGLADCEEVLRNQPHNADALDDRGFVYFRLGRFADAIADCTAALKAQPGLSSSLLIRGLSELRLGRRDVGAADVAAAGEETRRTYAGYGIGS